MEERKEQAEKSRKTKTGSRRLVAVILILAVVAVLIGFAGYSVRNLYRYESAVSLLRESKYADASKAFEALGEYRDASSYLIYARAAQAGEDGAFQTAVQNLKALNGFGDSSLLAIYYEARAFEEEALYENAQELYTGISLYRDVPSRLADLPGRILERDYQNACSMQEQGRSQEAVRAFRALNGYKDSAARIAEIEAMTAEAEKAKAYDAADALARQNHAEQARDAFLALGDYRDSAARVDELRELMYQSAEQAESEGDAVTACEGYQALGEYRDSASRAAALEDEYHYQAAWEKVLNGRYDEAYTVYAGLGDYKDSREKAETLWISRKTGLTTLGEGLASYELGGKVGLVNLNTNRMTVACYDSLGTFNSLGLAKAGVNGRYGFVDDAGMAVVPLQYSRVDEFDGNGLCLVGNTSGAYGYIDQTGLEVIPCRYQALSAFRDGVCVARKDDLLGFLNTKGEAVTEIAYRSLGNTDVYSSLLTVPSFDSEDCLRVSDAYGRYALMNRQYRIMGDFDWDEIGSFSEGLAKVRSDGYYGFINPQGEIVIAPEWSSADVFSDGLCMVSGRNGRYGYMDRNGELVIAAVYDNGSRFVNGYAAVYMPSVGWFYIDRDGNNTRFTVAQYEQAMAAMESGNYESAAAGFYALGDYGDAYEQMLESYYREAVALRESGELSYSLYLADQLDAVAQYRDSKSLALAIRADSLFEDGNTAEAWQYYTQVDETLRRHQDDYQAMFEAADELLKAGEYDRAVAAFQALGGYGESAARIEQAYDGKYQAEYAAAVALMEAEKYDAAVEGFSALGEYSRAKEMVQECTYRKALALEGTADDGQVGNLLLELINDVDGLVEELNQMPGATLAEQCRVVLQHGGYRDAAELYCRRYADDLFEQGRYSQAWEMYACLDDPYHTHDADYQAMYERAVRSAEEKDYDAAEETFLALGDYQDSAAQAEACREGRRSEAYAGAISLLEEGRFDDAAADFTALGDYRDSTEMVQECTYRKALALDRAGDRNRAGELLRTLMTDAAGMYDELQLTAGATAAEQCRIILQHAGYSDAAEQYCRLYADSRFDLGEYSRAWEFYACLDDKYHTHDADYQAMYDQASQLAEQEEFGAAEEAFLARGSYSDSAQRAVAAVQSGLEKIYQQAAKLQEQGQFDEAYDLYASLDGYADSADKLLEVAVQKAEHLYEENRFAEAAEVYRLLHDEEKALDADWHEAERLKQAGDYLAAGEKWLQIAEYADSRAQNYTMAGERAEARDSKTAIALYAADPEYEDAQEKIYQLGTSAHGQEDYETAVAAWTALGNYKDSGMNLTMDTYAYGSQLYDAKRYDEAAEVFRSMDGFSNTAERAQDSAYQAAAAALQAGDYADAESRFTALGRYSDSATMVREAKYRAAGAELEAGEYSTALTHFADLGDYKDSGEKARAARYALADEAYETGRYQAAVNGFNTIRGYRDADSRWQQARYMVYSEALSAGQYDEAISGFEQLAAEGYVPAVNEAYRSHYLKAQALDADQKTEEAYYEYVSAGLWEDAAEQAKARAFSVGTAYRELQAYEKAVEWFEIADDYSDAKAQLTKIGDYYFSVQDWQNAINAYKTLGDDAQVAENLCRIGQYYDMQSDTLNAYLAYGYVGPDNREGTARAATLKEELTGEADRAAASGKSENAVKIYKVLAAIDPAVYPKLISEDFESFLETKDRVIRIGTTDWKYLAKGKDGTLVFIARQALATGNYDSISGWLKNAKTNYFNAQEQSLIKSLWVMSKAEVSQYMPNETDRKTGGSGDIWTSTKDTSYYGAYYYTYNASSGSMGYAKNYSNKYGIRPALKLNCSMLELCQIVQNNPDRYSFYDGNNKITFNSEYLKAYVAAVEADQLKRYRRAMTLLERGEYDEASDLFTELGDYQESARLVTECAYQKALRIAEKGKDEEAISAFEALNGYSDSEQQIELAKERIRSKKYEKALRIAEEGKDEEAIAAFGALNGYRDSENQIEQARERIRGKRYANAEALEQEGKFAEAYDIFADDDMKAYKDSPARAAIVTDKAAEQKRQQDYENAATLFGAGKLEEALAIYQALGDYQDSAAKLAEVQEAIHARDYSAAKAALAKNELVTAMALLESIGDYEDSVALLREVQTGLQSRYDQALSDAFADKLQQAYQEFSELGDYQDSAKKAEIVGNLSRAGKTQKLAEGVLIYEFHSLWGIANLNTNVITPVKYTSITFDTSSNYARLGLAKVFISGGETNRNSYIHPGDIYGYINMNGEEVITCSYLFVTDFDKTNRCTVASYKERENSRKYYRALFGIMDSKGNIVTRAQWRTMGDSANLDWNDYDGIQYWKSSKFRVSSPTFTSGRMKVQNTDGLWGFINDQGKVLGEAKWKSIGSFSDGLAMVSEDVKSGYSYVTKYGFINEQGQTVGEVRWDAVNSFSQGLAAVQENGKWGFIDRTNTLVIPCRYSEVNAFKSDGTCDVRNPDGTWIVIDKNGNSAFFGQ